MENSKFEQIKDQVINADQWTNTDRFDFDDPISNNNLIFDNLMDNWQDLIVYYGIENLLADFSYLKESNKKKLIAFLDEYLFWIDENDFIVKRATAYYKSENACLHYYVDDYEHYLTDDLDLSDLTEDQRDQLESDYNVYLPEKGNSFYTLGNGFDLVLPKKVILALYKEHEKD